MNRELRADLRGKLSACGGLISHAQKQVRRRYIVECLEDLDRAYTEVNACLGLLALADVQENGK
jgi:hypothetical protein